MQGDDGIEKKKTLVFLLLLIRKFSSLWIGDDGIKKKITLGVWFL